MTKHVHRLKKHKYKNGTQIFFCTLPDCHYKIEVPLALGKESLCNICGEPFLMNEVALKLNSPHCRNCGRQAMRDENGKRFYIRKSNLKILNQVAAGDVDDLKSQLDNILEPEKEDI